MRRIARTLTPSNLIVFNESLDLASLPGVLQHSIAVVSPRYQCSFADSSTLFKRSLLQIHSHLAKSRPDHPPVRRKPSLTLVANFSSEADSLEFIPSDSVKEIYDKILESVSVKRTMSPNAWLWSLMVNCRNGEDIKLLFDVLEHLRRFRLANLRIHENFNCHLCQEIVKTCLRVGAVDFGKKALWKHNVYGLTPTVGSANHLLNYAKDQRNAKLLTEVMKLIKRNKIELQPSTADIVFSACSDLSDWRLMSKYSEMFIKSGIKLRKTSFDVWMKFAAKRGDNKALSDIEQFRSQLAKQHTILSGIAYAKGLILDRKPQDAALIILTLYQNLPENKRSSIDNDLQSLVSEWPLEVVGLQKDENKQALFSALKSDIPTMLGTLLSAGEAVSVNIEEFSQKEIPC